MSIRVSFLSLLSDVVPVIAMAVAASLVQLMLAYPSTCMGTEERHEQKCTLSKCKQRVTSLFARLWVVAWRPRAAGGRTPNCRVCLLGPFLIGEVRELTLSEKKRSQKKSSTHAAQKSTLPAPWKSTHRLRLSEAHMDTHHIVKGKGMHNQDKPPLDPYLDDPSSRPHQCQERK
eukprot:1161812-Pelagomonas_calceolata.AAC.4